MSSCIVFLLYSYPPKDDGRADYGSITTVTQQRSQKYYKHLKMLLSFLL